MVHQTIWSRRTAIVFYFVVFILLIAGCNSQTSEINAPADLETAEKEEITYTWNELQPVMRPKEVRKLQNVLIEKILPIVPEGEKEELNQILQYLGEIQERAPAYFEKETNLVQLYKTAMRLNRMNARLNLDNFDLHLIVATKYIEIAASLEGYVQTDEGMRLIEEFKRQGVAASKALID